MNIPSSVVSIASFNQKLQKDEIVEILDVLCIHTKNILGIDCSYKTLGLESAKTDTDIEIELTLSKDGTKIVLSKSLISCLEISLCLDNIDELSKLKDCSEKTELINQTLKLLFK
jgi:hypothetical protein